MPISTNAQLFNESLKHLQRKIASKLDPLQKAFYLHQEIAIRMTTRLDDIKRSSFQNVLALGKPSELVCKEASEGKIGKYSILETIPSEFPTNSFDACISNLSIHWVNDLPKLMNDVNAKLKPDGLFMCSVFGLDTLVELRECLQLAETERVGGISPHISPMMRMEDMGNLLSKTGFHLVTVDFENITVSYPQIIDLFDDLFLMGESNCLNASTSSLRRRSLGRETLVAANALYKAKNGNADVIATFKPTATTPPRKCTKIIERTPAANNQHREKPMKLPVNNKSQKYQFIGGGSGGNHHHHHSTAHNHPRSLGSQLHKRILEQPQPPSSTNSSNNFNSNMVHPETSTMEDDQSQSQGSSTAITKYKLVFLGEQSVGKTSLITRYMYDTFDETYQATIGIDFLSKTETVNDQMIRLQLWDTAGQERFYTLIPSYIRDSKVAVVVFDLANRPSFLKLDKWIEDIRNEGGDKVLIFIVGNKSDREDDREIETEEASQKASDLKAYYMETSAKTGENVQQLFDCIKRMLIESTMAAKGKKPAIGQREDSSIVNLRNITREGGSEGAGREANLNASRKGFGCCFK